MSIFKDSGVASGRGGLSSAVTAVLFVFSLAAAPLVQAQVSVDDLPNLTRGFSFSYDDPKDSNEYFDYYSKGDPSLETYKEFLRRDNINLVVDVVGGEKPGFNKMGEAAAVEGSVEGIRKQWGIKGNPPSNMSIRQSFNHRLIRGEPQMIDAYGLDGGKTFVGPVHKRAIYLKRDGDASSETVDAELVAYAERIAKEVEGISDRVMLYTMKGLPRNWPTPSFPKQKNVKRQYDAIIMIWPKAEKIIPSHFYGLPGNYRIRHTLNLAGYYYAAPAPAK